VAGRVNVFAGKAVCNDAVLAVEGLAMLKRLSTGTVVTVMLAGVAIAGPFEDGVTAYGRGDYAMTLQLWRPQAEQGHAVAQYNLGLMYINGTGVTPDDAEAVKWYRLAAEGGYVRAQHGLGGMYIVGLGGLPKDEAEAVNWFQLAADQDYAEAQFDLGLMYAQGRGGLSLDNVAALMWFNLAVARGFNEAITVRDDVAKLMTPDQIADAERLTREWKPKAKQ
jgi:uncharacterized protein